MSSPFKLLFLLLPSLMLFCSLFWKDLAAPRGHQEIFADNGHILEITLPTNVQKYLKRGVLKTHTPFRGIYVTDHGEKKIEGVRTEYAGFMEYVFPLPEGRFVGRMELVNSGCKARLQYRVEQGFAVKEWGKLRAAFCP